MGIFGPFYCAFCGRKYYGLSWRIKNGKEVCSRCYDKLTKDMPGVNWQKMTITQIREFYADREMLEAQKECSCCGGLFSENGPYTFVLADKSKICGSCADSVRIVRPVFCTQELDTETEKYEFASDDPLKGMTLEDLSAAKKEAEEERARRVEKYGNHRAVFSVDDVIRDGKAKEGEVHLIWGRVLLGRIDPPCVMTVNRRERPYCIQVDKVQPLEYNKKSEYLSEGHDGALAVSGDCSFVYPGDILTLD